MKKLEKLPLMIALSINTTEKDRTEVCLLKNGQSKYYLSEKKAQTLPLFIKQIFSQNKLNIKDLKNVQVVKAIGSATGFRVGLAFAYTLSSTLDARVKIITKSQFAKIKA